MVAALENRRSLALEWFMTLAWVAVCAAASVVVYRRGAGTVPLWVLIISA